MILAVENAIKNVPEVEILLDRLVTQKDKVETIGMDLTQGIQLLKERIARSREEASRVSNHCIYNIRMTHDECFPNGGWCYNEI